MPFSFHEAIDKDGVRLRYGIHPPTDPQSDRYVLILQGRGEYVERYEETAGDLARRGFGCVTFDFRGQGGSDRDTADPTMGYVKDVADYMADTACVIDDLKRHHNIVCPMVLTHSTGGLVAMNMLLLNPDLWQSVVMIAPFFGMGGPNWFSKAAKILSANLCRYGLDRRYLPGQKLMSPLRPYAPENLLTSDPARYERNVASLTSQPDLVIGGVSAGWLNACFRTQASVAQKFSTPAQHPPLPPITMVLAGNDQVVSNSATHALFDDHPNITVTDIPGARHEVLQERDIYRVQFWQTFDAHVARHPV